jgi:ABC-type amino acid transport substrate-binding protein
MNTIKLTLISSLIFVTAIIWAKPIRIGTPIYHPPFAVNNNKTIIYGFDIDLMKMVCTRLQWQCSFIGIEKEKLFEALLNDEIDMAAGGITITKNRKKTFLFSAPYFVSNASFFTLPVNNYNKISELRGKNVGVLKDRVYYYYLKKKFNNYFTIIAFANPSDMASALSNKKVAACFVNYYTAYYMKHQQPSIVKPFGKKINLGLGIGVMTIPKYKNLIEKINRTLQQIEKDGGYLKIYNYNFDFLEHK